MGQVNAHNFVATLNVFQASAKEVFKRFHQNSSVLVFSFEATMHYFENQGATNSP